MLTWFIIEWSSIHQNNFIISFFGKYHPPKEIWIILWSFTIQITYPFFITYLSVIKEIYLQCWVKLCIESRPDKKETEKVNGQVPRPCGRKEDPALVEWFVLTYRNLLYVLRSISLTKWHVLHAIRFFLNYKR